MTRELARAHLSVAEVARRLGVSWTRAYTLVRGRIGFVEHNEGEIRVPVERLERYLESARRDSPASARTRRAAKRRSSASASSRARRRPLASQPDSKVELSPTPMATQQTATALEQYVAAAIRTELAQLNAVASPRIACDVGAFSDSPRVIDGGSSEEEPMYKKIYGPYERDGHFKVHLFLLDGRKQYRSFLTEEEAFDFMQANRRRTVSSPVTMREAIAEYLDTRTDIRESSRLTLRYRLEAFTKDREQSYVQLFPANTAWTALVKTSSVDTLYGVRSAAQAFFAFCVQRGYIKRAPLADVQVVGKKRRGKPQLRIDEARAFLEHALFDTGAADGQEAVARLGAATALLLGLRSQEVVTRQVRDLDDGGTVFWVPTAKTEAGVRRVEVPEVLRPRLLQLAEGRAATAPLFPGLTKDGLRYWTETLCKRAGLPRVTPHGLRGTNATASMRANDNPHHVAAALGHASIGVTLRHYADPDVVAETRQRAAAAKLLGPAKTRAKKVGAGG